MVGAIKRWIKDWLGIDELRDRIAALESENLTLAKALLTDRQKAEDQEARIAFCENSLTAKATTAKIVPKPANWKQFRSAAEKASEQEKEPANG